MKEETKMSNNLMLQIVNLAERIDPLVGLLVDMDMGELWLTADEFKQVYDDLSPGNGFELLKIDFTNEQE